jgi:xanthine/uracil permease
MGIQHVIAMFGSTVLAPILMGFDPNLAVLMSGIGTLIFFLITGGKVPSYLGSSFAFIGVVIAATATPARVPTPTSAWRWAASLPAARSTRWSACWCRPWARLDRALHAPVVTGAVVAIIGLNLAAIPIKNMAANNFEAWMQALTFVSVAWWPCSRAACCSAC